ncbi:MAG: CPBP family intramembrane metalloprotease [Phycisphaerales bacterium]|nr:CPBP family intramembrane metalloprotease [Phycisphaerales bacterium]
MNDTPNENQSHQGATWSPLAEAMKHEYHAPKTKQGNPIDSKDPGTSSSRLIAIILTVLLVLCVVLWQNTGEEIKYKSLLGKAPPVTELSSDTPAPGSFSQVDIAGRLFLRGYEVFHTQPVMHNIETPGVLYSYEDRVRIIMLAGEFEGAQSALDRAQALQNEINGKAIDPLNPVIPDDLIVAELNALETIYTVGIDQLEENQRDQLAARYGLIGKVALTHGLDNSDKQRAPYINGFGLLAVLGIVLILGILVFPLAGFVLLILGVIQYSTGKMKLRNHVPTPGGSAFLETYALFIAGFLLISVGSFYISNSSNPQVAQLAQFSLLAQWLLLLTVLWGAIRGMLFSDWRKAIGWHSGEGVLKEIGCGIIAYIASLPIYILGVVITVILLFISGAMSGNSGGVEELPEPVSNPVFEIIANGNFFTIAMLFILATTWAPVVEEAIFRGALFRHLRGYMHWVFAALASAFLFAFMHDYGPLLVAPLIALGFMFAFMREWRGSLIAPMTAHFLHNFTLMLFMISLVQLIKDPI